MLDLGDQQIPSGAGSGLGLRLEVWAPEKGP